jgi:hypothetical protein
MELTGFVERRAIRTVGGFALFEYADWCNLQQSVLMDKY